MILSRNLTIPLILISLSLNAQRAELKVLFAGDIMGHDTQIASALAAGDSVYDYNPCFTCLKPYFTSADLVIGNLEVTLAGPPYKGYPRFSSPDELADALKEAGFHILLTANNHALDRELAGLERTHRQLDQKGILNTGTFTDTLDLVSRYPLLVEKNGILLALLNYTYGTNGLKVPPPAWINRIDTAQMRRDLHKAARAQPDFIIVNMHWGREYERMEHPSQSELARFLFGHGADAIIGSHPHVVQPIRGNGKGDLVVYSLGNFISNQRDRYRDGGIVFELRLEKAGDSTRVSSHGYLPVWVHRPQTPRGRLFTLLPAAIVSDTAATSALGMQEADKRSMGQFLMDTRLHLSGRTEIEPSWMESLKERVDSPGFGVRDD